MSKSSEAVIRWRKRLKSKLVAAMGGKCQCCGYDKCQEALEFHHIDPSKKEFSFGAVRAAPKRLEVISDELEKCILVCSNCHKEIHTGMTRVPENYAKIDRSVLLSEYDLRKQTKKQTSIIKAIPADRRKIFLSQDQLNELLVELDGNKSALARHLGVTETAIRKRLK